MKDCQVRFGDLMVVVVRGFPEKVYGNSKYSPPCPYTW